MKETKNYKLNLPQDTDYVDIEDFNSNFNNIDNIVKENNESVNNEIKNNDKSIVEIKNKVTELEKKIISGSSDSSSSGSEIDEDKLNEIKQELNKKIDDFIDTKGQKNGIAGLDENGKLKTECLNNVVKTAHGTWSDLATKINKGTTYTKNITIGFDADLITIFLKNKKFREELTEHEDYFGEDKIFMTTINLKTNIAIINSKEKENSYHHWDGFSINGYLEPKICTSSHRYFFNNTWIYNKCILKKISIEHGELKIMFEKSSNSDDKDVYLNIEKLAWSGYKFS